jgi:hypothetical protein
LGEVTYKRYWSITLFRYLRNAPDNPTIEGESSDLRSDCAAAMILLAAGEIG